MKTSILAIITGLIVLFISSCGVDVYFSEAQPSGAKDLDKLPKKYRGVYAENGDSMFVNADHFILPEIYSKMHTLQEIDESPNIKIIGEKIYNSEGGLSKKGVMFQKTGDTVRYEEIVYPKYYFRDSILLRKHDDFFVVNILSEDDDKWEVTLVEFTEDSLFLYYPSLDGDSEEEKQQSLQMKYKDITDFIEVDSSYYLIEPNAKDFGKLINAGLFKKSDGLKKIKK